MSLSAIKDLQSWYHTSQKRLNWHLSQLQEPQIHTPLTPKGNSIAVLVQHICGNLQQYICHGVNVDEDIRDRTAEFQDQNFTLSQLRALLHTTTTQVDEILANLQEHQLTEERKIQNMPFTVQKAIIHSLTHFCGHVEQIVLISNILTQNQISYYRPLGLDIHHP